MARIVDAGTFKIEHFRKSATATLVVEVDGTPHRSMTPLSFHDPRFGVGMLQSERSITRYKRGFTVRPIQIARSGSSLGDLECINDILLTANIRDALRLSLAILQTDWFGAREREGPTDPTGSYASAQGANYYD